MTDSALEQLRNEWLQEHASNDFVNAPLISEAISFVIAHQGLLPKGFAMADTLIPLKCDAYTIAASIIYPSIAARPTLSKALHETTDKLLFKLISGTLKMDSIHQVKSTKVRPTAQQSQIDNLRKMLLAMVDDIRVVLIKLADRLVALQASRNDDLEIQKTLAQEVMDYYVPLANRLGLGHLKWQLEDWSFRYLDNSTYHKISKALKVRRQDREEEINAMIEKLKHLLKDINLSGTMISGRAKHIYSIHRKMQRKSLPFEALYDTSALRILLPTVDDCYATLGIVHSRWPHIQAEFDDYIANPKENGYQSIHTAISTSNGMPVEIQIRTFEMHEQSELGVAAHWKYKENTTTQENYENKIAWLRDVLDWQKNFNDADKEDNLFQKAFSDRVYVFSPAGDAYDLEAGATALDFAYLIHTNVGHRCKGAKINDKLTPLTQPLKTGDRVEIMTSKENHPSRDWMRKELGFLATTQAIRKVRHWFHKQEYSTNVQIGAAAWEKAAKNKGLKKTDLAKVATHFNFKTIDCLFAALGSGDLQTSNIFQQLRPQEKKEEPEPPISSVKQEKEAKQHPSVFDLSNDNGSALLTQLAKCCNPIPGDKIMGYITQGKGISVHQTSCYNIQKALTDRPEKVIEINWKNKKEAAYRLSLSIISEDHAGLINDISSLIAHMKLSITAMQTYTNSKEKTATINLTIALKNHETVKVIMQRIRQIPGIISVSRN